jgi:hypothetical protein
MEVLEERMVNRVIGLKILSVSHKVMREPAMPQAICGQGKLYIQLCGIGKVIYKIIVILRSSNDGISLELQLGL